MAVGGFISVDYKIARDVTDVGVGSGALFGDWTRRASTSESNIEIFPWPTTDTFLFSALVARRTWHTPSFFFGAALALGCSTECCSLLLSLRAERQR
jgi:hypothetical protein